MTCCWAFLVTPGMKYLRLMMSMVFAIPQWPWRMTLWYESMMSVKRYCGTSMRSPIHMRWLYLESSPSLPSASVVMQCLRYHGSVAYSGSQLLGSIGGVDVCEVSFCVFSTGYSGMRSCWRLFLSEMELRKE